MERIIRKTALSVPPLPARRRVAAYARVSSGKVAMLQSLSAQVSYYSGLIQRRPDWEYAGVYADERMTYGQKANKPVNADFLGVHGLIGFESFSVAFSFLDFGFRSTAMTLLTNLCAFE